MYLVKTIQIRSVSLTNDKMRRPKSFIDEYLQCSEKIQGSNKNSTKVKILWCIILKYNELIHGGKG